MLIKRLMGALLVSLLFSTAAMAASTKPVPQEKVQPADFPELAAQIRTQMEPGGRYLVRPNERAEIDGNLSAIERLFEGHASVNELTEQQKVDLLNRQERVNALLTQRDGDEMVCRRERKTGSHRVENVCATRRVREAATRNSQQFMQDMPRIPVTEPSGPRPGIG